VLTGADLHYEGSLTLDVALMEAADILPFEKVQVVNVNNGSRLETYVIEGDATAGRSSSTAPRLDSVQPAIT
jgi:Aspartate 1-decarboxylase